MTADNKVDIANELEGLFFNVDSTNVWTSVISPTPSVAISSGVAIAVTASLTIDPTSNQQAYFAYWPASAPSGTDPLTGLPYAYNTGVLTGITANSRLRNAIPPVYNTSRVDAPVPGYESKPYTVGNAVIAPTDLRSWIFQYNSGIFWQELTSASYIGTNAPGKIELYVYVGETLATTNFSSGSMTGVTAGAGLSGGGTSSYITLDVNLGVNSGLTFSGDDIILDTNIAGNGLSFSNGVLSVTNAITAGAGLTSSGSNLDVQVDTSGLTISNANLVALQDTITGDRTFSDSVTVNGNLTVNGTVSYINTENLLVEDNIITLNATYSGPYNAMNTGIEANLGGGTYATLIWDYTNSLWSVGFSGSVSPIITEAGSGLTKSSNTLSVDFGSITGAGLTQSGSVISVDNSQLLFLPLAGGTMDPSAVITFSNNSQLKEGTYDFAGSSFSSGGGISQICAIGYENNWQAGINHIFDNNNLIRESSHCFDIIPDNTFDSSLRFKVGSRWILDNGDIYICSDASAGAAVWNLSNIYGFGLTQNGGTISVSVENGLSIDSISNSIVLGGTLSQNTTINGSQSYSFIIDEINDFKLNFTGSATVSVGLSEQGLVYSATPSSATPLTLIHKQYVDDQIGDLADVDNISIILNNSNQISISATISGQGLTYSSSTGIMDINWGGTSSGLTFSVDNSLKVNVDGTSIFINNDGELQGLELQSGQGLTYSNNVMDINWGGTSSGLTFSVDNSLKVNVDGSTIIVNNDGELQAVSGSAQPVYDQFISSITTGDNQQTGATLSYIPNNYSRIQVYVNGQLQRLGNGTSSNVDCYFDSSGKSLNTLTIGDELYWNGLVSGFDLSSTDKIDIIYES
jgi:hypothetical protein